MDSLDKSIPQTEETRRDNREPHVMNNILADAAEASIYVCDTETYELLYLNKNTAKMCGKTVEEARGNTCYRYLKNFTKPCEDCYMDTSNSEGYVSRVYTSPVSGKHYMTRGKLIDWNGRKALVEYLTDETERIDAQKNLNDMINGIPCGIAIKDCYDDGRIEDVYVNNECLQMINIRRHGQTQIDAYNVLEVIHPADRSAFLEELSSCVREDRDGSCDFRILMADESVKWINAKARVASTERGKHTLYIVYTDIDQNRRHQLALNASHRAMELASRNANITFWYYDLDSLNMTYAAQDTHSYLGYPPVMKDVPESLIGAGWIHPEDADACREMFKGITAGKDRCECTIRMLNVNTGKYEWLRNVFTGYRETLNRSRQAIGLTINVDLEQELNARYEHELALRQSLTRDSESYFHLNLTNGTIEEFQTLKNNDNVIAAPAKSTDAFRQYIMGYVVEADREKVCDTLFIDGLKRAYDTGLSSVSLDFRTREISGEVNWLKGVATIVKRPVTGEVMAFVYCHDITREKKNQLALESILHEDIDGVTLINVKSRIARIVRTSNDLTDMQEGAEVPYDSHLIKLLSEGCIEDDESGSYKSRFMLDDIISGLKDKPFISLTHRARNRLGERRWKRTLAYYLDNTLEDIVLSRRDITSIYEEEQRQKLRLQAAFNDLNRANNAKNEFISRMSHDMRTAMNAIVGFVGLLRNEDFSQRAGEYLNGIDTSSQFLLGLIQDILDLGNLSMGQTQLTEEKLSPDEFKNSVLLFVKPLFDEKRINFRLNLAGFDQNIMADKARLYQIVNHLLSNAVKYTHTGGNIGLLCEKIPDREDKIGLRFSVSDDGVGMSDEFQKIIFEPFTQETDNSRSQLRGCGLGLAIAKKLAVAMGGGISVSSKLGIGSVFALDLYFNPAPDDKTDDAQDDVYDCLSGLNVLVVEDNELNRRIIGMLLERMDCVIDYAVNGLEATEKFASSSPYYYNAVLMDIRMPVMDGLEATKRIRADARPDSGTVPIISVTADVLGQDDENPEKIGITAQLTKPIDADRLYQTIARFARRA